MDFQNLLNIRQSVRKYADKTVEPELLNTILESARMAPSACNSQPWHIIVLNDKELKNKIAKETFNELISFNKFTLEAPIIIVIVIESPKMITKVGAEIKKRDFTLYDIGIVAEHICLQAAELGLGTCMLGWFNEKRIMRILDIPKSKRLGLLLTLGYPETNYKLREKSRKNIKEIVSFNAYKN